MTKDNAQGPASYMVLSSSFGPLGIVWRESGEEAIVQRVILPSLQATIEAQIQAIFDNAQQRSHPAIRELGNRMQAFLGGDPVAFALDSIALDDCSVFQQRVLRAEHGIPRGWVSTYGLIADHLGAERAARAVGTALAHNPFPLIIPCHRAIRSNGELGGYQGGLNMKRRLLEMEGVPISETGKVIVPRLHYSR
jgi:methylated-DNA-[protein]-cysteine S-methyltransferase